MRYYDRLHLLSACGAVVKRNGRWHVVPAPGKRPRPPFRRLFSARGEAAEFETRLFGAPLPWRPRSAPPGRREARR